MTFRLAPLPLLIACAFAPLAPAALAAPAATAAPAPAQAQAQAQAPLPRGASFVREVEGIREYRLANGLQVLLIPDASKPTVTVNVTYHVGSRMERYGETGMAHLLEHLMFKSTKKFANVGAELSKRGMQFNGTTNFDRTNYYETFPADKAHLAWALKMEAERMTSANVIRKDLDTEMTVVRNEMESGENDPVSILVQKTQAAAYQWHNYGKDVIGARADVENVNIAHLQAFYRQHYQPDNATLIVAGAFDSASTLQQIAADFGALKKPTRVKEPTWTVEPVQDGEREVTLRRQGGVQALFSVYHVPAQTAPDYAAFEVINSALTDTPNGRLHKRLVEAGLATEVFGWSSRSAEPGQLSLGVMLKKEDDVAKARDVFLATVEGLKTEPVTADELKRAQLQWAKDLDKVMSDPQRLCLTLSESIASGDWRLLFVLRDRLQALTLAEVNQAASTWIKPSNRTLGRFVPTDAPDRTPLAQAVPAEQALKGFVPKAAVAAGEVFEATPANIDARTHVSSLPSGLKLALLPKKSRGQTVELQLKLRFGSLASLKGQADIAGLTAAMLPMGTRQHTRAQISDAFDALKTNWSVAADGPDGATASLSTTRDNLIPALKLLGEVLREPAFPAAEFEQLRRQSIAGLEQASTDPEGRASNALSRLLDSFPADDPRHADSFDDALAKLKAARLDALAPFHQRFWGAEQGTLAAVGDFDEAALKAAVQQVFGDWKSATPFERLTHPVSKTTGQRVTEHLKDKANAVALGALPLALQDQDADMPALRLAAHVLGAGGFDSRLLTRLRQKDGLSYGAGAWIDASPFEPAGSLGFYAIYAPENRAKVEQGFAEEIARFVKDGITADELASAKKAIQTASNTRRASDKYVAGAWVGKLRLGRTFKSNAEEDARIAALSVDQVNAAIRKWFDPARVNWVIAGDMDKGQ